MAEYTRVLDRLADLAGHEITNAQIRSSISAYNVVRAKIRTLEQIRICASGRISAAETSALLRAGTRIMPEEFTILLDEALDFISKRNPPRA